MGFAALSPSYEPADFVGWAERSEARHCCGAYYLPAEIDPRPDDLVQPFRIDPFALRGRLVRLGPTIDRILSQHDYPEPVAAILGEAIALAVVLAGMLKYDGIFTLQTKSDGPVRLIVADVSTAGAVRGYAQYDRDRLPARNFADAATTASVPELIGSGYIAFTVDQGEDTERYQGIVDLVGTTLAECAQHYFRQSEQIQAGIKLSVARSGKGVNLKKGQFVAPHDIHRAAEKVASTGNSNVVLTERGSAFGYNNLVVDMRGLKIMRDAGWPVVFDATHSVQLPGGAETASGGQPQFIEPLARAAVAAGVNGVFVEVHDQPEKALSDGANALRLSLLPEFWRRLTAIHALVSGFTGQ